MPPQVCTIFLSTEYANKRKEVIDWWSPTDSETALIQYMDDLLVCCNSLEICEWDTISMLGFLTETNNKASKEKLQYLQEKVVFLGHCISRGTKHLTTERVSAIKEYQTPKNERQLRPFLGLVGYCRD